MNENNNGYPNLEYFAEYWDGDIIQLTFDDFTTAMNDMNGYGDKNISINPYAIKNLVIKIKEKTS